jgi:hypothetical protein
MEDLLGLGSGWGSPVAVPRQPAGQVAPTTAAPNPVGVQFPSLPVLLAFLVARLLVVLHNGSSGNLFGALSISSGLLRTVLNVLIFPLFFLAHTAQVFLRHWHLRLDL